MTTDAEAERMARAARRLREALRPRTDVEDFDLQILSQALRVELVESLAGMAERIVCTGTKNSKRYRTL
jgi:hypothetical protein